MIPYTCRSYIHSRLLLLLQDTPKYSLNSENPVYPTALESLDVYLHLWLIPLFGNFVKNPWHSVHTLRTIV